MGRPSSPHLHNGYWRVRVNKRQFHLGKDRKAAFAEFHRLMAAATAESPADRPVLISGAVSAWLAIHDEPIQATKLRAFVEFTGRLALADVGVDLLERYHVHLKTRTAQRYDKRSKSMIDTGKKLGAGTVREYMSTAVGVIRWSVKQRWCPTMPDVPSLPKAVEKHRDVPPERLVEILDKLPSPADKPLKFVAFVGCRPSECCRLEWRDIHTDRGVAILEDHKTGKRTGQPRVLFLGDEALALLRTMKPTIGPVFVNRNGKPYTSAGLRTILLEHGGITPYALRHSFAQRASELMSEQTLGRLLGHRDLRTTRRYYHVQDRTALQAAKAVTLKPFKPASETA